MVEDNDDKAVAPAQAELPVAKGNKDADLEVEGVGVFYDRIRLTDFSRISHQQPGGSE